MDWDYWLCFHGRMSVHPTSQAAAKPLLMRRAFWSRMSFRFAFCFWTIFCLGQGLTDLVLWFWPWLSEKVSVGVDWPFRQLTLWTGRHVFHLSGVAASFHPTGSGDTALGWINLLVTIAISLIGSVIWTAISEARKEHPGYQSLHQWLRLGMRFVLAAVLLAYGFDKVFPLQFPNATGERLTVTYANSSPMGLLWRFMGSSALYRIFGGVAEVIPGLLLMFRRTSTLGALGAAAVMLNVVALNFGYDVSVKLFSSELLIMSLFLLLPDLGPMWRFFIRRQDARLSAGSVPLPERRALSVAAHCLQVLTIGYILYTSGFTAWKTWHDGHTPLSGPWTVQAADGALKAENWSSLYTSGVDALHVASGVQGQWLAVKIDVAGQIVTIFGDAHDQSATEKAPAGTLRWTSGPDGIMQLMGTWHGQPASLSLRKVSPNSKLETRGFHLVQEYPVNQ